MITDLTVKNLKNELSTGDQLEYVMQKMRRKYRRAPFYEYMYWWFYNFREKHVAESTAVKYRMHINFLRDNFPQLKLNDFDNNRRVVQWILDEYGKTRQKQTLLNFKDTLFAALRYASEEGFIIGLRIGNVQYNSVEQTWTVEQATKKKNQKRWLDMNEFFKLKNYLEFRLEQLLDEKPQYTLLNSNLISDQAYLMLFAIEISTGVRFAEALGIKADDIHPDYITIDQTYDYKQNSGFAKTKNESSIRNVVIGKALYELITEFVKFTKRNGLDNEAILIPKGTKIYASTYNLALRQILDYLNIERVSMHKLRHSYISTLLSSGIQKKFIEKQVGHANGKMIDSVYGHLQKEIEQREIQKFDLVF